MKLSEAEGKATLYRSRRSTSVRAEATAGVTSVSAVTHNADAGVLKHVPTDRFKVNIVEIYFTTPDAMFRRYLLETKSLISVQSCDIHWYIYIYSKLVEQFTLLMEIVPKLYGLLRVVLVSFPPYFE